GMGLVVTSAFLFARSRRLHLPLQQATDDGVLLELTSAGVIRFGIRFDAPLPCFLEEELADRQGARGLLPRRLAGFGGMMLDFLRDGFGLDLHPVHEDGPEARRRRLQARVQGGGAAAAALAGTWHRGGGPG